jgi:protein TonB
MAAPYAAFPPAIRHDTDVLEITRTWNFTQRDSLETKAAKR